jgi:hypothetical protein
MRRITGLVGVLKKFAADRRGGAAIMMGLVTPMSLGFGALGVEATHWYMAKRELQSVVDAAALSGAIALANGMTATQAEAIAEANATRNDYTPGAGDTVTYASPPTSGAFAGDLRATEAIILQEQEVILLGALGRSATRIRARAVAMNIGGGEHCIIGLDPTMEGGVEFSGTADALVGCGVAANSNDDKALMVNGNAELTADPAAAVGDIYVGGSAQLVTQNPPQPLSPPTPDPYGPEGANLQIPANPVACTATNLMVNGTATLDPGRYCGGITANGGADITFNPGTYIMDGGEFKTNGGASLTGTDVTFALTGSGTDYAQVDVSGGTVADLSAPTGGEFSGILFFQDPNAPSFQGGNLKTNRFLGGATADLTGVLYFPSQEVLFTGGVDSMTNCLHLIARKVTITGSAVIQNNCAGTGVDPVMSVLVRLVE